jgi:hypothetical protein
MTFCVIREFSQWIAVNIMRERERERNAFAGIERHQAFALAPVVNIMIQVQVGQRDSRVEAPTLHPGLLPCPPQVAFRDENFVRRHRVVCGWSGPAGGVANANTRWKGLTLVRISAHLVPFLSMRPHYCLVCGTVRSVCGEFGESPRCIFDCWHSAERLNITGKYQILRELSSTGKALYTSSVHHVLRICSVWHTDPPAHTSTWRVPLHQTLSPYPLIHADSS